MGNLNNKTKEQVYKDISSKRNHGEKDMGETQWVSRGEVLGNVAVHKYNNNQKKANRKFRNKKKAAQKSEKKPGREHNGGTTVRVSENVNNVTLIGPLYPWRQGLEDFRGRGSKLQTDTNKEKNHQGLEDFRGRGSRLQTDTNKEKNHQQPKLPKDVYPLGHPSWKLDQSVQEQGKEYYHTSQLFSDQEITRDSPFGHPSWELDQENSVYRKGSETKLLYSDQELLRNSANGHVSTKSMGSRGQQLYFGQREF